MSRPPLGLIVPYVATAVLFGGWYGLLVAAIVVGCSFVPRLPRWAFWLAAVVFMAAAPVALIAQGLPAGPIAGSDFGTRHLAAHACVGFSLALAAWAGLGEIAAGRALRAGDAAPTIPDGGEPGGGPSAGRSSSTATPPPAASSRSAGREA